MKLTREGDLNSKIFDQFPISTIVHRRVSWSGHLGGWVAERDKARFVFADRAKALAWAAAGYASYQTDWIEKEAK